MQSITTYLGLDKLMNHRLLTILLLGFSSGLPLLLTSTTLQAWYAMSDTSLVQIGLLSLIGQPYLFKFLWAPLLDRFSLPFLGRRLGWILICQVSTVIGLAAMAFISPSSHPIGLAILAYIVVFFSATQDVGIDAYRTERLAKEEYASGASLSSFGYRVAMIMGGGVAMIMAARIGWSLTYLSMAGLMLLQCVTTYCATPIPQQTSTPTTLYEAVVKPFQVFLSKRYAIGLLLFIVIYRLNDAFTTTLIPTFLLRELHFTLTDVGAIYKTLGLISTIAGSLMGGIWMLKRSLYQVLWLFGVLQGLSVLPFIWLAWVGKHYAIMVMAITLESFCTGLSTVAFIAFLTHLCDQRYTATQFALFTALAAVGRIAVGPIAGVAVTHIGWANFFFGATLMTIPGLLLLHMIKGFAFNDSQEIHHHDNPNPSY